MLSPERRVLLGSFIRFAVVGTTGLVVDTAVLYAVRGTFGVYGGALVSYVFAATWTWWLNRTWTFRGVGQGAWWQQWLRFMAVNLVGFGCNRTVVFILFAASAWSHANPVVALAAGAVAGLFANFTFSRRFVFR